MQTIIKLLNWKELNMSKMKRYCVTIRYTTDYEVYVDAKNEDEAWDLVQDLTDDEIRIDGPILEAYDGIEDIEEMDGEQ
jgi:hypothetical protein